MGYYMLHENLLSNRSGMAWKKMKILRYKHFLIFNAYGHSTIILENIPHDVLDDVMYMKI